MIAALEQSGGAWLPTIEPEANSLDAIATGIHGHAILLEERDTMLAAFARGGWRVVAEDAEGAWWTTRIARS